MFKLTMAVFGFVVGSMFDQLYRWRIEDHEHAHRIESRVRELGAAKPVEKTIGPAEPKKDAPPCSTA